MRVAKVGSDMAKRTFRMCVLFRNEQGEQEFANNQAGFVEARDWLKQQGAQRYEIAMEPTGRYGEAFADFFWSQRGFEVFQVQPEKFAKYAASRDTRTKSDRKDAIALAKFLCDSDRVKEITKWRPKTDTQLELRDIQMRVRSLTKRLSALQSQLQCGVYSKRIRREIQAELDSLEENKRELVEYATKLVDLDDRLARDRQLLETIPGIGTQTAVLLLCMIDFRKFKSSRQLACFLGLTQQKHESGTSIRKKEHISKKGSRSLRSALYYQSWVAIWYNAPIHDFAERAKAAGKAAPVMRVACMRKLVTMCWAIVVSGKKFDPNYCNPHA